VGATGSLGGKSDGILIAFTETEGNKAYIITRVLSYDQSNPAPTDVLMHQVTEKYGKPHYMTPEPSMQWSFDPNSKPADACGSALIGSFVSVGQFSFPVGAALNKRCDLNGIHYTEFVFTLDQINGGIRMSQACEFVRE
jgi:hypothetical protein